MQKKVTSLALALILLLSLCTSAFAATPRYNTTIDCKVALGFSGTTAKCNVIINGMPGTNKIVAKVSLEKQNSNGTYSGVTTWEQTVYSSRYTLDDTSLNCIKGATYRLTVTATVSNSNGLSDSVSNYITGIC